MFTTDRRTGLEETARSDSARMLPRAQIGEAEPPAPAPYKNAALWAARMDDDNGTGSFVSTQSRPEQVPRQSIGLGPVAPTVAGQRRTGTGLPLLRSVHPGTSTPQQLCDCGVSIAAGTLLSIREVPATRRTC